MLADMLQIEGMDVDKNAVQRIECGKRFVTDIELKVLTKVLEVGYKENLRLILLPTYESARNMGFGEWNCNLHYDSHKAN